MKKVFLLAISIIIGYVSNAQIVIEEVFQNDLVIIGNISSNAGINAVGSISGALSGSYYSKAPEHKLYCRIFKDKTTYGILICPNNRVEDQFEFALGTDIEKAKKSINDILTYMDAADLNTSISVRDEDDRRIQINLPNRQQIVLDAIDMNGAFIFNQVILQKQNLVRALKLLDKKAERKVREALDKNGL